MFARMSSWNLNMTRWRVVTGVPRHPGKAVLAASTAALNSSAVVSGIRDTTSCVACDNPDTQMRASHTHTAPKIDSEGRKAGAYGVGDVDVLVGARLDELAADEEAHPWLRGVEERGSEVSRDGLTRRRWPPQPQRRAIAEGYEGTGG